MGRLDDEASVRAAMRDFIARNEGIFGVGSDQLRFASASYIARTDTWYVQFNRLVQGSPIWRGGVTARIRFGKLILLGVDTYPGMVLPQPEIGAAEAIAAAELAGPAALGRHTHEQAALVALPLDVPGGIDAHLAWEVHSRTTSPRGHWVSFVDAATGEGRPHQLARPSPSCPLSFPPQHQTSPATSIAHACRKPTDTATAGTGSFTLTGSACSARVPSPS